MSEEFPGAAHEEVQPEEIETLKRSQQGKSNSLGNPALVLLCLPVQLVRTDSLELSQNRPENTQVQIVTQINPRSHRKGIERDDEVRINIVERLGHLQSD